MVATDWEVWEGKPRLLNHQSDGPAPPGGSPGVPKLIVSYNLFSRSWICLRISVQWDRPDPTLPGAASLQSAKPPQTVPLNLEEQWLYSETLPRKHISTVSTHNLILSDLLHKLERDSDENLHIPSLWSVHRKDSSRRGSWVAKQERVHHIVKRFCLNPDRKRSQGR